MNGQNPKDAKLVLIFFISFINIISFITIAATCGGTPFHGALLTMDALRNPPNLDPGRYYLSHRQHYTEVSKAVWTYMLVHNIMCFINIPLLFVYALIMKFSKRPETPGSQS